MSTYARNYYYFMSPAIAGGSWYARDTDEGHAVIFIVHFLFCSVELVGPTPDFFVSFCFY